MAHVERDKRKLLARVRRIAGQVGAVELALESGAECDRVLVQIAAIKGAVHALMMEVMTGHLEEHVAGESDPLRRRHEAETLMALLKVYAK